MRKRKLGYLAVLISFSLFTADGVAGENKSSHGHAGSIGESPIEREIKPELPTVVFYKLPRCGICAQIDKWLVKLDKDNSAVANYVRKNSTDKTIHPEMNARGIQHHGVAFLDAASNTMWAAQAHGLREDVLNAAFADHVASGSQSMKDRSGADRGE